MQSDVIVSELSDRHRLVLNTYQRYDLGSDSTSSSKNLILLMDLLRALLVYKQNCFESMKLLRSDMIWYDSSNMSRLVLKWHEMIQLDYLYDEIQ